MRPSPGPNVPPEALEWVGPFPAASTALDPELQAVAEARDASGATRMPETSVDENRRRILLGHRQCAAGPPVDSVEDRMVPGAPGNPDVPVRVYAPGGPATATVVYLHGGGWFTGDLDYPDEFCRFVVRDTGARVVSVDYRLAPEHPYPAPLDDSETVLAWAEAEFPDAPLGIAGDSAGGNLAAATLLRVRDSGPAVDFQVLIYPVTDSDFTRESYAACERSFPLGREDLEHCFALYVPDPRERTHPGVAPLRADLSGLPPPWSWWRVMTRCMTREWHSRTLCVHREARSRSWTTPPCVTASSGSPHYPRQLHRHATDW